MIGRGLGLMHATEQASNEGVMERCVRDGRGDVSMHKLWRGGVSATAHSFLDYSHTA